MFGNNTPEHRAYKEQAAQEAAQRREDEQEARQERDAPKAERREGRAHRVRQNDADHVLYGVVTDRALRHMAYAAQAAQYLDELLAEQREGNRLQAETNRLLAQLLAQGQRPQFAPNGGPTPGPYGR